MLVISRKEGEQIRVGDDVVVRILGITASSVKVGIDAPRSVAIHREEVWEAVHAENQAASSAPDRLPRLGG